MFQATSQGQNYNLRIGSLEYGSDSGHLILCVAYDDTAAHILSIIEGAHMPINHAPITHSRFDIQKLSLVEDVLFSLLVSTIRPKGGFVSTPNRRAYIQQAILIPSNAKLNAVTRSEP
jgi:hypothetical protein